MFDVPDGAIYLCRRGDVSSASHKHNIRKSYYC